MAIGALVAGALNYLFYLALGRMVDVEIYGEIITVISLFQIISFPAGVLGLIATWQAADYVASQNFVETYNNLKSFSFKLAKFGIPVVAFFIIFITLPAGDFLKIKNYRALDLIWLAAFLSMFFGWAGGIINGLQKFKTSSYANVFGALIKLIVGLILVKIGMGAAGVSAGFLFSLFFSYLIIFLAVKFLASQPVISNSSKNILKKTKNIRQYVFFTFLSFLFFNILGNADMILAKHNLTAEEAGHYGALLVAGKIIIFITGAIAAVFFSISSSEHHQNKSGRKLFWQTIGLVGGVCFLFCLICAVLPKLIFWLFFGQVYLNEASYLIWFALMASFFSLNYVIFFYFLAGRRFKKLMLVSTCALVEIAFLYFFGHNVISIILIALFSQMAFFLAGILLILTETERKKQLYEC